MRLTRIWLVASGAFLALYGLYCLYDPRSVAHLAGMSVRSGPAVTELRAMYGGLEIGLGGFFIYCGFRDTRVPLGLMGMVICFGALGLTRTFGLLIDGMIGGYNISAALYELMTAIIATALLWWESDP